MSAARNGGHKVLGRSESSRLKDTPVVGETTIANSKDDDAEQTSNAGIDAVPKRKPSDRILKGNPGSEMKDRRAGEASCEQQSTNNYGCAGGALA